MTGIVYCPAQAGLAVYGESPGAISQIEDSLITGVLRERLLSHWSRLIMCVGKLPLIG